MSTATTGTYKTKPVYPRYRWVVLSMWMIPHVWGYVFLQSLGFLLPSMRSDLGLTPIQEGFLGSAPQVATMLLAIPFGWLLSKYSPKLMTSISFFAAAGLVFFQGWAPVYTLVLLARFLFGVAAIFREPSRVLIIRQWVPPNEVVIANAMANFMWGIVGMGFMLVPLVLELLDNNWRHTTYVFGVVLLAMALGWQLLGKERETPEYKKEMQAYQSNPLGALLRYKELWALGIGMLGNGIGFSGFAVFWPSFRLDEYGMSLFSSALVMAIGGLVSSFTGIAIGVWVSRHGNKKTVLALTGVVLAVTSIGLLWWSSLWLIILVFVIQAMGWSFFPVTLTIPYELEGIRPREIAVAVSSLYTMLWVGAFIGPILAGVLQESTGNVGLSIQITSLAPLLMTLGAFFLSNKWNAAPGSQREKD